MKIMNKDDTEKVEFRRLYAGEVFKYNLDGEAVIAMKTDKIYDENGCCYQAVNLSDGELFDIAEDDMVTPIPNAQLNI